MSLGERIALDRDVPLISKPSIKMTVLPRATDQRSGPVGWNGGRGTAFASVAVQQVRESLRETRIKF